MSRTQIATRVTDGTLEEIKEYANKHGLTQAEAMRQLLDTGLDVKNGRAEVPADKIRSDLDDIQEHIATDEDESDIVRRKASSPLSANQIVIISLALILLVASMNLFLELA